MKTVQLNCVFGDMSPGIRELEDEIADKLIDQGNAVEVETEDEGSSDGKSLKAELKDAQKLIDTAITERDTAITERDTAITERDNALTALTLAQGVQDGKASPDKK